MMDRAATLRHIKESQTHWADSRAIRYTPRRRVFHLSDNLFAPLKAETETDFKAGDGDELGRDESAGKMFSLYSSSALACNVFDYWRGLSLGPLLQACGIQDGLNELRFEQQFATGLPGTPPNLDLLLSGERGSRVTAIESKLSEPFQSQAHAKFRPSYFRRDQLWRGLERCRELAEAINTQPNLFNYLNAAQLLKHVLGLHRTFTTDQFELLYLWYDVPDSTVAGDHRAEVKKFSQTISTEIRFRSVSYQEMFESLLPSVKGTEYTRYLRSHYFPARTLS
ncbi:MAG: hypothetical protein ABSC21_19395 [Terriglobia bacterium]|jgi:hypothetical protein